MIPFELTTDTFAASGGAFDASRAGPAGLELALAEMAADADTLALYHLHRGDGLDAGPGECHLAPVGDPGFDADGALFDAALQQCFVDATAFTLRGRTQATAECWFRLAALPADGQVFAMTCQYYNLSLCATAAQGTVELQASVFEEIAADPYVQKAMAVHAWPAADTAWHHLAATWHKGVALRLWLDGQPVGPSAELTGGDLYSANATVYVGRRQNSGSFFSGAIDEVRYSSTVRYAAPFAPQRRAAAGSFTSPAFDSARLGADWAPLDWAADVPVGAAVELDVRTGDALAAGQVDAPWQPAALADALGRYSQWRAALTPGADPLGRESPAVSRVTAAASQAGTNLYHGSGDEAAAIDYETPVARFGPLVAAHVAAGLDAPAVHWFGLRSVSAAGQVSRTVDAELRLELDAAGQAVPPRPAPVESLSAAGAGGGQVALSWLALPEMGDAAPEAFRVYSDAGTGTIDFGAAVGEVPAETGRRHYQWTSAAQAPGATVRFAVRAESAAGGADAAPAEVAVTVDADPPRPVGHLSAEPALGE